MKIVLISDTHEKHEQVLIPECDVLVHAGDLTFRGEYKKVNRAINWLIEQPAKDIVFVAGNHDWLFEEEPDEIKRMLGSIARPNLHYLENNGVTIDGVKFWGSPITPRFFDWAFNCDRGEAIKKYWDKIPDDTDVLVTHGPPLGIQDTVSVRMGSEPLGCADLRQAVKRVRPKIHVFGHIHGGHGTLHRDETTFYNASVVDEAYKVVNEPFIAVI